MKIIDKLLINGEWVDGEAGTTIDVLNPYDNSLITKVAEAKEADVDKAVAAAKAALEVWKSFSASERGNFLLKLADKIEEHAEELAQIETMDTGHPIRDTRNLDVQRTAYCFRYFGGMADKLEGSVIPVDSGFLNYMDRQPIGVVGQIVPWNFPLMFTSWKMAPALAAGNTVVIKPAELTPLSTLRIADLMMEVGIPAGVVNVLVGRGSIAGQHLAEHEDVGKICFTGSTAVGEKIIEASAKTIKKVQLELGGKGANIIFEDANIPAAVGGSAFAIFHNQGQACIAGSRLIIHENVVDEFLEKFTALAKSVKIGDPADPSTEMGPLTSQMHLDRVLEYCEVAKKQGGEFLTGGHQPDDETLKKGCFVMPTIVKCKSTDRVFHEEVFGPFVVVTTFETDEEAMELANATEYGLGSGLWTSNISRAHKFAREIHAGMVWINCYKRVNPASPFGGVGRSGYGREMGFEAMREYTVAKSIWVNIDAKIPPFYPR